jgi:hypothetical protein
LFSREVAPVFTQSVTSENRFYIARVEDERGFALLTAVPEGQPDCEWLGLYLKPNAERNQRLRRKALLRSPLSDDIRCPKKGCSVVVGGFFPLEVSPSAAVSAGPRYHQSTGVVDKRDY